MTELAVKKKRRKAARPDAACDGERLMCYAMRLLLAAGVGVTPEALAGVIRSVPRSEEDAYSPCACGMAARLLIVAEGKKVDGRFMRLVDCFLGEIPRWSLMRRAAAEEAVAVALRE